MIVNKVSLFFLLIGTVYCQIQNPRSPFAMSQLPAGFPDISDVGSNLISHKLLNGLIEMFAKLIEDKCTKNGSPNPFSPGNLQNMESCFSKATDGLASQRGAAFDPATFDPATFDPAKLNPVKMICDIRPQLEKCSKSGADGLRSCLNADERPYLDDWRDGEHRLYEYLCYNDGERVTSFMQGGGLACLEQQNIPLSKCGAKDKLEKIVQTINASATNLTANDNIFEMPYVKEVCTDAIELRSCVVSALRGCDKQSHAELIDAVADIALRATPCKKQMPVQLSAGAVVGIVIGVGLLLLAVAGGVYWRRRRAGGRTLLS